MRWSPILAALRYSHSASLSCVNFSRCNNTSFSTLPRRTAPQQGPSPDGTPLGLQEQARSSSQSFAIANSGKTPCPPVTEVGNSSSGQVQTAPISSSTKTKDSPFKDRACPQTTVRPSKRKSLTEESLTSREAGKREAVSQEKINLSDVSRAQVNASSKPSSARVSVPERHGYEANASSSNHAKEASVINAAKTSVNKRNGEASSSMVKAAGKVNPPDDEISSAATPRTRPSKIEDKEEPRVSSSEALSKNGRHVSTTHEGERSAAVVHGALNKKVGKGTEEDVSVGALGLSEDITASSTNRKTEYMISNRSLQHRDGSVTHEEKKQAESKKSSFVVSLPVTIFSDWWFTCFSQGNKPYYTSLNHPLNKVYVWLAAYQRVHFDATGHYTDGPSSATLLQQLLNLQNAVLDGRFRWGDKKLIYLPTPVGHNEESLSNATTCPSFQDRVVHETLYLVLEPIFEARFSARSHGFRPGRDAHTALRAAQRSFQGCTWFISGNLSSLHDEIYATHLVESALRVVKDTRVTFLLKSGFLGSMSEQEGRTSACMFTDQVSFSKLRNLLYNAFLDRLDWFMDEQICSFAKKEPPSSQSSSNLLLKPERVRVERPHKLEYLRYGTEILVACNGIRDEAELVGKSIIRFFKEKFHINFGEVLSISHISDGVKFLDHVISRKIVHPIVSCRRASNGRVFEKRAHRIRLCVNANRECCLMHLKKIKTPTSLQHIEEMLLVLDNWYHCAENKEKVMQCCKLTLCYLYAKGVSEKKEEGLMDFADQFKEAMRMAVYDQTKSGGSNKANLMQDFFWIPEHENVLREHIWLQSKSAMTEVAASFKNARKVSPQQCMSQVLWEYLGGAYPSNDGNGWEPEVQMQTSSLSQEYMVDLKLEDVAQSVC